MSVDAASSRARVNRKRDAPMVSGFCANEPCGGGGNRGLRPLSGPVYLGGAGARCLLRRP